MPRLFYERTIMQHNSVYRHTVVSVYSCDAEPIEKLIAGCVDNAAGYQTAEIAARLMGEYSGLRERGATATLSTVYAPRFIAKYQHYRPERDGGQRASWDEWEADPQYCDARIELETSRNDLQAGYDLMRRCERVMLKATATNSYLAWRCPAPLIAALAQLRAERVWRLSHGTYGSELCTLTRRAADEFAGKDWELAS